MPKIINVNSVSKDLMEEIGFHWHTDNDGSDYVDNSLVEISQKEADEYYDASAQIYDMFIEAGEYVIENNLFFELGIAPNLIEIIKLSWENDVHWHLYGRFDFAGGIDNRPIKLIEFNADTPTALFETAIIQWAYLKANNIEENSQFNLIFDGLVDNFKRLIMLYDETDEFSKYYDGWKILFSSARDNAEEEQTVKFLQMCATEAGFETKFCYLDEVAFDDNEGIFCPDGINFEYWFKLYPWEDIALEDQLPNILTNIMRNKKAIILNPAYTVMFQSKRFMKILKDLFPDSPYLLDTAYKPLDKKYVLKRAFGREGANIEIVENSKVIKKTDGAYENYKEIYQEFVELPKDNEGNYYQAGVFYAYEAIGLGFRKGGVILDNYSKFVGHYIK